MDQVLYIQNVRTSRSVYKLIKCLGDTILVLRYVLWTAFCQRCRVRANIAIRFEIIPKVRGKC